MCRLCFVLINSVILNLLCFWILYAYCFSKPALSLLLNLVNKESESESESFPLGKASQASADSSAELGFFFPLRGLSVMPSFKAAFLKCLEVSWWLKQLRQHRQGLQFFAEVTSPISLCDPLATWPKLTADWLVWAYESHVKYWHPPSKTPVAVLPWTCRSEGKWPSR